MRLDIYNEPPLMFDSLSRFFRSGGNTPQPEKPPVQPPPAPKYMRVTVWGDGQIVRGLTGALFVDDPMIAPVIGVVENGRLRFELPSVSQYGHGGNLTVTVGDSSEWAPVMKKRIEIAADYDLQMEAAFEPLPALRPRGQFLEQVDGTRFTVIMASEFALYERYLAGQDITDTLRQLQFLGFNAARVWTAYQIDRIGRLVPKEHDGYYAKLRPFLRLCAKYGIYVELTAFTGPYGAMFSNDDEKVAHWVNLIEGVRGESNVWLELVNERDNVPNLDLPWTRLLRPVGVLASHGSNIMDAMPPEPFWDLAGWHTAAFEWQRKVGHGADDISDTVPVITNETPRVPDNETSVVHCEDAAEGGALLCAGSCFHSVRGKLGLPFEDGVELECARAYARGARSVPLLYQDGFYTHEADLESGNIIRAYSRTVPGIGKWTITIRS